MEKWIEERPNAWTYVLKCPKCGFRYSPKGNVDGTISSNEIYSTCPKCGEKLEDPAKDERWQLKNNLTNQSV